MDRRDPVGPVRSGCGVWGRSQAIWATSPAGQSGWPKLGRLLFSFSKGAHSLPEFSSLELAPKNETRQDAMCNLCLTSLATTSFLTSCCLSIQHNRSLAWLSQATETQGNSSASSYASLAKVRRVQASGDVRPSLGYSREMFLVQFTTHAFLLIFWRLIVLSLGIVDSYLRETRIYSRTISWILTVSLLLGQF